MSTLSITHARTGRANGSARPFFERIFNALVAARTAQAAPMVAAALARASDAELSALGRSPAEIAQIRAAARNDMGRPIL